MKVLITGITGFVGSHLAESYLKDGAEVYGLIKTKSHLKHIKPFSDLLKLIEGNLLDPHSIDSAIKSICPDRVHHLGAQSFVPTSWISPADTIQTNLIGTLNLFESIRRYSPETIVQIASSSEIYGNIKERRGITENDMPNPLSPYGVSKLAMDRLGYQYAMSHRLRIVVTRAFNHTGPRRGEQFVTSNFAKQIAEISLGKRMPVIEVGNLDAWRDWTDVRDVVIAYRLAVDHIYEYGIPFNIASGTPVLVEKMLGKLIELSGKSIEVKLDKDRLRPSDIHYLEGDSTKFREKTGWSPSIPFDVTLKDLLDYWIKNTI